MPDIRCLQEVHPFATEHFLYTTVEIDQTVALSIEFDHAVTLEDIQIQSFTTAYTAYLPMGNVSLLYPSGHEMIIVNDASNWSMNQDDDARKLWYTLPPHTVLRWKPTNSINGRKAFLTLVAIGQTP